MLQKRTALLVLTALLATEGIALAEAPTSQFGFEGWPYRNESGCDFPTSTPVSTTSPTVDATQAPTITTSPNENDDCGNEGTTLPPAATTQPTVAPTQAPTVTPAPTRVPSMDEDYTTDMLSMQEQNAWNLLNADRAANGLPALPLDAELSAIARKKSEDMRDQGYFSHTSPTYGKPADMLTSFGYAFTSVGENISHHATVEKAQAAFLSSSGHRQNMMSSSWTKVGIGVCFDANGFVYVTQLFVR